MKPLDSLRARPPGGPSGSRRLSAPNWNGKSTAGSEPSPTDYTATHLELDHEEVHQGRLRRYYRLTESGRWSLAAEAERQAANARIASERLRARRAAKARGTA